MSKNLTEWLLASLETDPRFVTLDPSTIIVWLKLVRILHRQGSFAGLLDANIPGNYSPWADVAIAFRVSEAELHQHVRLLIARRLLVETEKGAVFVSWPGRGRPQ
jgi:hypothetical protein